MNAAAADPAGLAAIHAAAFTRPPPWPAAAIAQTLTTPGAFLCAAPDGFLIGRVLAGEAELLTLAVRPEARRHGIGRRLVAEFLRIAAGRGAETAFLEVAADNAAAIALYRAAGFAGAGRRRGYYGGAAAAPVDALVLSQPLTGFAPPS
ncbi:MAG: ribosomal-protein-alanine acetyltransferase [Alphaproteobacteria bacterium HGW-Alphaproteobacteria-6]|nr:MAG: ribosomal-protein-alanine acetyltransferase [Alphaproteobacteria bacterium HGW-Alphaproteobacteria-6]